MRELGGRPAPDYRPDVDGLRAVAIATVVLYHAAPRAFPGGFAGVDVFFVISGYLITGILLREQAAGAFSFASFYARRVKRIFPALALVLAATGLAGWIVLLRGEYLALGREVAAGAGFVANLQLWREAGYFDAAAATKPLLHLWSLGVEEQFYLLWPWALAWAWRRRSRVFALAGGVAMASFAFDVWQLGFDAAGAFYLPFGRFWELMLGAAVAAAPALPRRRGAAAWLGAALLAFAFATLNGNAPYPGTRALAPALGATLLVAAGPRTFVARALAWRPFVGLGLVSYPLYLWHWPLLAFLARFDAAAKPAQVARGETLAVAAALALAVATHLLVERRANALFRRRSGAVVAAASAAVAAVGLAGALHWPPFSESGDFALARLEAFAAARHADAFRDGQCFLLPGEVVDDAQAFARNGCEGDPRSPRPKLLLVGDSHAAHLYPGLAAEVAGRYDVGQLTVGFCVPLVVDLNLIGNAAATPRCKDDNAYILARAEALRPALIVVGGNYLAYESAPGFAYPDFDAAFLSAVRTLRRRTGAPVLVVGQAPVWKESLPTLVADALRRGGAAPQRLAAGLDPDTFAADRRLRALPWGEGVTYLSLTDALCEADGCRVLTPGEFPNNLIGFDASHFSQAGSRFVARTLVAPWIAAHPPR